MKLFRKQQPTANQSIENMRESLDLLEKRERVVTLKMEEEVKKAKECMKKKNKNGALICMKRKKAYQDQASKIMNQRLTIENMILKLEGAATDMDMFHAQKAGAMALKSVFGNYTPDKIDKQMDQVRDAIDAADDISAAISQPIGIMGTEDDDELLAELAEIENEEFEKTMLEMDTKSAATAKSKSPAVAAAASVQEDDDLAALESDMAI